MDSNMIEVKTEEMDEDYKIRLDTQNLFDLLMLLVLSASVLAGTIVITFYGFPQTDVQNKKYRYKPSSKVTLPIPGIKIYTDNNFVAFYLQSVLSSKEDENSAKIQKYSFNGIYSLDLRFQTEESIIHDGFKNKSFTFTFQENSELSDPLPIFSTRNMIDSVFTGDVILSFDQAYAQILNSSDNSRFIDYYILTCKLGNKHITVFFEYMCYILYGCTLIVLLVFFIQKRKIKFNNGMFVMPFITLLLRNFKSLFMRNQTKNVMLLIFSLFSFIIFNISFKSMIIFLVSSVQLETYSQQINFVEIFGYATFSVFEILASVISGLSVYENDQLSHEYIGLILHTIVDVCYFVFILLIFLKAYKNLNSGEAFRITSYLSYTLVAYISILATRFMVLVQNKFECLQSMNISIFISNALLTLLMVYSHWPVEYLGEVYEMQGEETGDGNNGETIAIPLSANV
ncbi:hypothetical protein TRFO_15852 [Tritrichomonas foetus]|uniref:Uncharacterized protein n=1 Tax=Tritrichomonas foetus TaxID=1144522 RepID=A0A1J4KSI7_9EUKA|nr:hypothetical protein TRFO_15852 [Tritrichomonas foetus]|eukprot:OHT13848.1 hypothetical protein TRFO_15852 [Tritrichomonas foetus]